MKLHVPFIQLPLSFDVEALRAEVLALDESCWRPHPQGFPGNDAVTLVTVGGDPESDGFAGPMRPTPWLEQCPYIMQVMERIGGTWGRSRLMRLSGQAEVTPHVDTNYYWREHARVHVPIITTPAVRFQCGTAEVNMAPGECWLFDTWRMHRVLNEDDNQRIHLVVDTVGGAEFWNLAGRGRTPGQSRPDWQVEHLAPVPGKRPDLDYERMNVPVVMTPWELREHIVFLLNEAQPDARLQVVQQGLLQLARRWHALWACHGEQEDGWPRYRRLLEDARRDLVARGVEHIRLKNGIRMLLTLEAWIFRTALADQPREDGEYRHQPGEPSAGVASPAPKAAPGPGAASDPAFDRPLFIVSAPRSGSTLLFETLSAAPGLHTIGNESHQLIEGIAALDPVQRGHDSNRLTADDATPEVVAALRARFHAALRDRDGRPPAPGKPVRMLEKTPKNALRVPFLRAVFPEARFIYLHRDPRQVLGSMIDGWQRGGFRMYPGLPGWTGQPWSFLLVPGWRDLIGRPLGEIVAAQWERTSQCLLDDLADLDASRWISLDYASLLADPKAEVARLCTWAGLDWDRPLGEELPLSRSTMSRPDPDKWRRHADLIEPTLGGLGPVEARIARVLAG
ncbi:MAG TPA: sulfotransferase [Xanthomonadaceae bacterium]|nr:sulfotransferase [Xanthomonadaceae bacterium]